MWIWLSDPSLNMIIDKFQLHHIWDEVLLNTPALHFKQPLTSPSSFPPHLAHTSLCHTGGQGAVQLIFTSTALVSMVLHETRGANPLAPCVTLCTSNGSICCKKILVSITFFLRPGEAMLFSW